MLMYFLIGLSLVLIGIVGLQFSYLYFVDRMFKERKRYMQTIEHQKALLSAKLKAAEQRIEKQQELLETVFPDFEEDESSWADVIDER